MRIGRRRAAILKLTPPRRNLRRLSRAEREVALAAARGSTNDEIAAGRETSVRTVESQLRSVFRKLGIASRTELAAALGGKR